MNFANTNEKAVIMVISTLVTAIVFYGVWRYNKIEAGGIFMLGKVMEISDSENGEIYTFTYKYKNLEFHSHVKGFLDVHDSLLFIKISSSSPELVTVLDEGVPKCYVNKKYINTYWTQIPKCK